MDGLGLDRRQSRLGGHRLEVQDGTGVGEQRNPPGAARVAVGMAWMGGEMGDHPAVGVSVQQRDVMTGGDGRTHLLGELARGGGREDEVFGVEQVGAQAAAQRGGQPGQGACTVRI